ncbi:MAG: matrixin family metalloprotease [Candidatus Aenigmarchaeota archaeon]|nr:matrixin family metalloprotease [Candidatus Aenigmarchaeota archaeon]
MVKWLIVLILILLFFYLFLELFKNLPFFETVCINCENVSEAVFKNFTSSILIPTQTSSFAPLLYENIRWSSMPLKVYLNVSSGLALPHFSVSSIESMREALEIWENATNKLIIFEEVENPEESDIIVNWVKTFEEGKRILGEGGPVVRDTGLFNLTVRGEIYLRIQKVKCLEVITAMHEIGHVLGFDHSKNPEDIMYPIASCSQRITEAEVKTLEELYKIPPKPELYFLNASVNKPGKYLAMEFGVKNSGLINSFKSSVSLILDNRTVRSFDIPELQPGEALVVRVSNLIIPSFKIFQLLVDAQNHNDEIYEGNNLITLVELNKT